MPSHYIYLISSLPWLSFGVPTPFSSKNFLEVCRDKVPEEDQILLESVVNLESSEYKGRQLTLAKWCPFDKTLRNELVKIRAARKHIDPTKFIRSEEYIGAYPERLALVAYRSTSILEAEKMLDLARWHFLDELSLGHYFDLDILINLKTTVCYKN